MNAHFDPVGWKIVLKQSVRADLSKPEVLAVFVHEYVHYVQMLVSTLGRVHLGESVRMAVLAGLHAKYGGKKPGKLTEQVDLRLELSRADPALFGGSVAKTQFGEHVGDLQVCLGNAPARTGNTAPHKISVVIEADPQRPSGPSLVSALAPANDGKEYKLPLRDGVFFENMARQVQRNFLRFNNLLDTSDVDKYSGDPGELHYSVISVLLSELLPSGEDIAKWTIVVSQLAILCSSPGQAFAVMVELIKRVPAGGTIEEFVVDAKQRLASEGYLNNPPVQRVLNELVQRMGTAMRMTDNWELREFTKLVCAAYNALEAVPTFFVSPTVEWATVRGWLISFGCPPIHFADGEISEDGLGVAAPTPWFWYSNRLENLLA